MKKMSAKNKNLIAYLFFIAIFLVGIFIFKDYGISWDDPNNYAFGKASVSQYVNLFKGEGVCTEGYCALEHNAIHGPFFETVLVLAKRVSGFTDIRQIYLLRHFLTFLLFLLGLIFFYKLCLKQFKNFYLSLLATLFLFVSPRIFGDAFYNSVDIGALAMMIFSAYTMLLVLEKKTLKRALIHALVCAVGIATRSVVVIAMFATLMFFARDYFQTKEKHERKKLIKIILLYPCTLIILVFMLTPFAWSGPINYIHSLQSTASFNVSTNNIYFGEQISANQIPWHFNFLWIAISTPIFYLVLFLCGIFYLFLQIKKQKMHFLNETFHVYLLIWFILPLLLCVVLRTSLYNGWRHLYFIYPAFIYIAIIGFDALWKRCEKRKINLIIFSVITVFAVSQIIFRMVLLHPFENIYFNVFVSNESQYCANFDRDYWGLAYKQALEYLLRVDPSKYISVFVQTNPGIKNSMIISADQRSRIVFESKKENAKYYISGNFPQPGTSQCAYLNLGVRPFYVLRAGGLPISYIIRLHF